MSYDSCHDATIVKKDTSFIRSSRSSSETKEDRPHTDSITHHWDIPSYPSPLLPLRTIPVHDDPFGQHQKLSAKTQKTPNAEQGTAQKLGPCVPFQKKVCYILTCQIGFSIKGCMRSALLDSNCALRCGTFFWIDDVFGMNLVFNSHKLPESVHIV